MIFADFIKRSGRTRASWAEELGISPGFLSDLLNGKKQPALTLAVRIERLTGGAVAAVSWVPEEADTSEDAA